MGSMEPARTDADESPPDGQAATDESPRSILRVEDISKRYEGVQALRDVSLDIYEGEVLALVGDNGAGKSTLIKILAGVIKPTGGSLYLRSEDGELRQRTIDDPNEAKEAGIETVFQELELSGLHDVTSNVFMARELLREDLWGRLLRRVDREEMERQSVNALEEIGFRVDPTARTSELSGGQRQAVAVARALISDPRVVLLDEPTAEVSVDGSEKILELIGRLQEQGRTVIFISHNLQEVLEVADRVAVLRDGALVDVLENDESTDRQHLVSLMTGAITVDA